MEQKTLLEIELPENCGCGSKNMKIWGTKIDGRVGLEVRCMRCGKILCETDEERDG
jgi:hypothetical protein